MTRTFLRFPNGLSKALTLSYDDGVEQDIRLIEILNKHGLKATFNINSGCFSPDGKVFPAGTIHRRMTEKQVKELYSDSGHEVAIHGYTHPWLETLPPAVVAKEILDDRQKLESIFEKPIRGMAYPFGTYNDTVVDILGNCGIVYSRTVVSTNKFDIPTDWLRMPATCHHSAPELMELAEKFVTKEFTDHSKLFYLWGHSYEFEANDNWSVIEKFAEYMGNRDDVWYATNIEVYDYVQAFDRLVWSTDMSMIYNPSAISVWVQVSRTDCIEIKAGETVKVK